MLRLSDWPYLTQIPLSGAPEADAIAFLLANGREKTAAHSRAVASESGELAARFDLEGTLATRAALLHDVSAVMKPQDMMEYALTNGWAIDEAERAHSFLLHQRMSREFARDVFGEGDEAVLSAVACHTTLKGAPKDLDMLLFLADKLAWDREGTPPYKAAVSAALGRSLACASLAYIRFALENGMILAPHRLLLEAKDSLEQTCLIGGNFPCARG